MSSNISKILNRILIRGIVKRHYSLNPNNKFNFNYKKGNMEQTHYFYIDNLGHNISGPYDCFWENAYFNIKKKMKNNNEFDLEAFKNLYEIIYLKDIKKLYSIKKNVNNKYLQKI